MHKVEHAAGSFRAVLKRQNVWYLSCLLILAAAMANAGEPIGDLAVARNYPSSKNLFSARIKSVAFITMATFQASNFHFQSSDRKKINPESSTNYGNGSVVQLEKQNQLLLPDPFVLVQKSLGGNTWSNARVSIETGYGQVWRDEFALEKEFSQRLQPSFAYVSASFSF